MAFLSSSKEQEILPVVALRDGIVFPSTENVLIFGRPKSLRVLEFLDKTKKDKVVLVMQKDSKVDDPKPEDLYSIGVVARIVKKIKGERGELHVLVRGEKRIKIEKFVSTEPFFLAEIKELEDKVEQDKEVEALIRVLSNNLKKSINLGKPIDFNFLVNILNITTPLTFSYNVAMVLDIKPQERQQLLEIDSLKERLKKEVEFLNKELELLELEREITEKTRQKFERGVKESFLREKKRIIEEQLGERRGEREIDEYKNKIKKAGMPKEVEKKALKELNRLAKMSPYNPEASYIRTYLDWLIELPWNKKDEVEVDIKKAKKILDEDHYGLKKIKERILEYIAVMKLKKEKEKKLQKEKKTKKKREKDYQPTILCFVGPPGVGKTSLGKSIAKALGRKFVKMSLGGIRDEAEIRGHRRTYVGALPGRIIQGIKEAGSKNPVFMLDEIDKIGRDYRGDPSAALLEALDPEQNHSFVDHYLDVPFDLSDVLFITTANILDTIPPALLDRLEIIHFPGYTEDEKFHIAKRHLIPKQLKSHALEDYKVRLTDKAIQTIIRRYTREAGVRELERQIASVMRKVARRIVENGRVKEIVVSSRNISKYLGPFKYSEQMIEDKDNIGISTGLAWTQAGGDILFIEVAVMPGKGNLTLTGQLGDVMKESCQAALSYIRSRWDIFGLKKDFFSELDIHVHVPEGAVPKDGPSAGIAITVAMLSALTKIPVRRDVGMTGEITLRGRVLEIGGVKEKVIAAHRAGIKKVIMPKNNKKDLEDIPKYVLKDIKFVFIDHLDEVWKETLRLDIKAKKDKKELPRAFLYKGKLPN